MPTDIDALNAEVKLALEELASQCGRIGNGLLNIAPPTEKNPSNSILYLTSISSRLDELSHKILSPKWGVK